MPVAMTTSSEPEPERTERSTQDLPAHPTVEEMETADKKKVLQWIEQRDRNILENVDGDLEKFNKAGITGRAFLLSNFKFFKSCALSPGASLVLSSLVDEVRGGKFISWT
jgi:hypothetical protein